MILLTYVLSFLSVLIFLTWNNMKAESKHTVLFMLFKYREAVVLTLRKLLLRYYSCHVHSGMLYLVVCPLSRSCPWLIIARYVGHSSMCASQSFHLRTVRDTVPQTSFLKYENMRRRTKSRHCLSLLSRRKVTDGEKRGRMARTQQIITVALCVALMKLQNLSSVSSLIAIHQRTNFAFGLARTSNL